ncbi:MAG: ABC transporter permease [Planctomycetes bacterium]|nr:ABC transporter permease [Planctomycetota bacterium]
MADVTVIRPRKGWAGLGLGELWEFRELLWVLAAREVKVRYKQTFLGATWAVIQPITVMIIFTIFFGKLAGLPSDGLPYPVFAFAALLPWGYFSHAMAGASGSVIEHRGIISKVYFPRLILPLAPLLSALVDFGISFLVLAGLMVYYGIVPSAAAALLPLFVLLAMLSALALGLWLAALNAHYRDFRYVVPFLLNVAFFASPIAYPSSMIRHPVWKALYGLNPMAGVIEGFRWALLRGAPPGPMLWVSTAMMLALLVSGLAFYRRMERTFVDVV